MTYIYNETGIETYNVVNFNDFSNRTMTLIHELQGYLCFIFLEQEI